MVVVEVRETVYVRLPYFFAALNVVVVPAEHLAGLQPWKEFTSGEEKDREGDDAACDEIDGVVVREVHGRPPEPHHVEDE